MTPQLRKHVYPREYHLYHKEKLTASHRRRRVIAVALARLCQEARNSATLDLHEAEGRCHLDLTGPRRDVLLPIEQDGSVCNTHGSRSAVSGLVLSDSGATHWPS